MPEHLLDQIDTLIQVPPSLVTCILLDHMSLAVIHVSLAVPQAVPAQFPCIDLVLTLYWLHIDLI